MPIAECRPPAQNCNPVFQFYLELPKALFCNSKIEIQHKNSIASTDKIMINVLPSPAGCLKKVENLLVLKLTRRLKLKV